LRDDDGAHEGRSLLAKLSLRQIDDENFALVHRVPKIDEVHRLGHNMSNRGACQELAQLILDRCKRIAFAPNLAGPEQRKLMFPPMQHDRIEDSAEHAPAIRVSREPNAGLPTAVAYQ
jgi:hypothetical protein